MVKEVKKMQLLIRDEMHDLILNTDSVIDVRREGGKVFFCYNRLGRDTVIGVEFCPENVLGLQRGSVERAKAFIDSYVNFIARGEGRMILLAVTFYEVQPEIEECDVPF